MEEMITQGMKNTQDQLESIANDQEETQKWTDVVIQTWKCRWVKCLLKLKNDGSGK